MSHDSACSKCTDVLDCGSHSTTKSYPSLMSVIACEILAALDDLISGLGAIAGFLTTQVVSGFESVAFSGLTDSFVAAVSSGANKVDIKIFNGTDASVDVSFDGINIHEVLDTGQGLSLPLGSFGRHEEGGIYLRYSSAIPSMGNVSISYKV